MPVVLGLLGCFAIAGCADGAEPRGSGGAEGAGTRLAESPEREAETRTDPPDIRLTHSINLRIDDMPIPVSGPPTRVATGPSGERILFHPGQPPSLFDSEGGYLRDLGRPGEGPGEYRIPVDALFLPGDSVLVIDAGLRRGTVLGPDFVQTLGANQGAVAPGEEGALMRRFVHADSESFWVAHVVEYRVSRFTGQGELLDSVHRTPPWFDEPSALSLGHPSMAPPPLMTRASIRGDTLWMAFQVARPGWEEAWKGIDIPPSGELRGDNGPEVTDLVRSRIEAVSLETGALLASGDIDQLVVHLEPEGRAVVYDLDFRKHPRLQIMDLSIHPSSP